MKIDLRLGCYRDALADVECDALISDPPYGLRTHKAVRVMRTPEGLTSLPGIHGYAHWTPSDVDAFVEFLAPRVRGWFACMTSDDLIPVWRAAYERVGLYSFAPVVIVQPRPRLIGDGPANWCVYMMTARPRNREFATWGCLPGIYMSSTVKSGIVGGAKPVDLMRKIVADYTRPGDVVCDPCVGGASTLLGADLEGRASVGAEVDPVVYADAVRRIEYGMHVVRQKDQGVLF